MISSHQLAVQPRERTGSRYAQRERAAGRLPAILYGHGKDPVPLSLDAKQTLGFLHSGEKIFSIEVSGEGEQTVMLKDLQFDYLGNNVIHVDLARVNLNEEIESNVPIRLVGEAIGLKHAGAMLTHPTTELHVRCTVATLPDSIEVDVTELDLGGTIHAGKIALPESVTLAGDPEAALATITMSKAQISEDAEAEATEVESGAAEPEVITEKKESADGGDNEGKG